MYLVYNKCAGMNVPFCICNTPIDAEEMCLSLAQEDMYARYYISVQCLRNPAPMLNYITLANSSEYYYKEVPCID
jgi:hypothetical protein